jgi:hypothetical protein
MSRYYSRRQSIDADPRRCSRCTRWLPADAFGLQRRAWGLVRRSWCRTCSAAYESERKGRRSRP